MARHAHRPSRLRSLLLLLVALTTAIGIGGWCIMTGLDTSVRHSGPLPDATFELAPGQVPDPIDGSSPTIDVPAADHRAELRQRRPQSPAETLTDNHLVIPAIKVNARLSTLGVAADNSLILPTDVDELTYWSGSAAIEANAGGILVAGHVDNADQGEGALYQLHSIEPGDAVYLTKDGAVTRWKVIRLERFTKQQLPDWAFQNSNGPRELHLVTCGGQIITDAAGNGTYEENVIATAVPF